MRCSALFTGNFIYYFNAFNVASLFYKRRLFNSRRICLLISFYITLFMCSSSFLLKTITNDKFHMIKQKKKKEKEKGRKRINTRRDSVQIILNADMVTVCVVFLKMWFSLLIWIFSVRLSVRYIQSFNPVGDLLIIQEGGWCL